MLPRSLRLTRRGFELVFRHSARLRRAQSAHFSVSYGTNDSAAGSAIIVPKKAVKSAVSRHRVKRQVRAVLHSQLRSRSAENLVLIVSAKAGSDTLSFAAIEEELSPLINSVLH